MAVLFRRIRGRAAGHVVTVNPLNVLTIEPTSWGGSEINFSDVYAIVSRDNPVTVQMLLEGRVRLCSTPQCDHDTDDAYQPLCTRCRDKSVSVTVLCVDAQNLVVVAGRHGFA